MELDVIKNPDLVVALDIGSTYSGYAWQWRSEFQKENRGNIEYNDNWGAASFRLRKTTTCLLLDKNQDIDSFGHLAEQRFCNECDQAKHGDLAEKFYFFKNFKMLLYNPGIKAPMDVLVDDHFGQDMPLIDVMSKFIKAMRDHFLDKLKSKNQSPNLKIMWVVTVPAIWTDAAKHFMRLAAEKSGIERKHLLITLEPEAAALSCMHLPSAERKAMGNLGEKGDSFIAVDLGGGTTDILALQVSEDGMLKEIDLGSGGSIGGQNINDAFFQVCTDAFEGNVWVEISRESLAREVLDMENDFEGKKVVIGTTEPRDEHIQLSMPRCFKELLEEGKIKLKNDEHVTQVFKLEKEQLMFNSKYIREKLFSETISRVSLCLCEVLKREPVKRVKKVILVGGFTESPLVVEKITEFLKKEFPDKQLFVPSSPFTAVLNGAVLYGHDPLIFYSRISRATYGIEINKTFEPGVHRKDKKWTHKESGIDKCKDILSIHIRKGQTVRLGMEQPSKVYYPVYKNQTNMEISVYMSIEDHLTEPAYTTDDHCKKIGNIDVDMPDTKLGLHREVTVTMIYGGTELNVMATNKKTKQEYKACLHL